MTDIQQARQFPTLRLRGNRANTDLFKEANDVLADLRQADDDVVDVDVVECGVVAAFSASLIQNQVPAVHGRQEMLVFPAHKKQRQKSGKFT